jgi:hypothetical protein
MFLLKGMELVGRVAFDGDVVERRETFRGSGSIELVAHVGLDSIDQLLVHGVRLYAKYRTLVKFLS